MQVLVDDAVTKGAKVANHHGRLCNRNFFFPAVVYPVTAQMKLFSVGQFGPVVPVALYDDIDEVFDFVEKSNYGQQASIFGHDAKVVGPLVDVLANQVCRVNLNTRRGPDAYPIPGRKDSAEATLSATDALRCFSIRSMVAAPENATNRDLLLDILQHRGSNLLNADYLF
jgi:glyceraldehyde-3-phosphate dehydrogenase (NADP+)